VSSDAFTVPTRSNSSVPLGSFTPPDVLIELVSFAVTLCPGLADFVSKA
jgi:hypothetical protein